MRRTRATYHYKIRKLKKDREKLQKEAMAKAISENNSRQLWTEVRKIRNKNSSTINCIDDITGNSCIAELFSKKYNELYNSVSYEEQEMNDLMSVNKKDVEIFCVNSIDDTLYKHTHKISLAEVQAAVQKLKVGKSDCVDGFVSDNLKKGTECLYEIIALLFSTMLTHGVAPAGLLLSTLVPIPKNKRGNKSDSNNYRQIAISSLLGKLFDIIILEEQHHGLITDELQFGFKKNASTVLCTSLLMETVEYYNENDTDCYLLFARCI